MNSALEKAVTLGKLDKNPCRGVSIKGRVKARGPKSSLFNSFSRILKRAELPSMPIHSLRHTHAVLLLEAGNGMKYVQERLGHGSMRITADVYSHVSKKIEASSMEKYETT